MKKLCLGLFAVLAVVTFGINNAGASGFNQNNIIDDSVFDNTTSMTASQIDNWLNASFGSNSCISTMHGFSAPDPTGYSPTTGFTYGGNVSAGRVIYDSAVAYGINPQVLLTTLQKEQSLVSGSSGCGILQYAAATGYGCPDGGTTYGYSGVDLFTLNGTTFTSVSGTCVNSSLKVGFSQQVIRAAWLLKFGEQRSQGNMGWAVINGSWNNSDDPQTCYGGPMTQGTWQRCPSGATAYYDGYTTIDGTAVHMDDGATAALYWYTPHFSGNQHFYDIYTGWFGNTIVPVAFKTATSGSVYIQTDGYKFSVPSMAMLQDFGISPQSVQTVSQTTADVIPYPDSTTGLSTSIGYVVKSPSDTDSDGGTVYIISAGHRYEIPSMTIFGDYGFSTTNLTYLPLAYIYSFPDGGTVNNFIATPSHNAFQVSNGTKQIIFDGPTFLSLDPGGTSIFVSDAFASTLSSGLPITNREILVGQASGAVYLLDNGNYYSLSSMNVYNCWGFNGPLGTPFYRLANDGYIGSLGNPTNLSCSANISGTNYLLNSSNKVSVPAALGFSAAVPNSDLQTLINKLPTRSTQLGTVIKSSGPTVWYTESGIRKSIPSMADFTRLGLTSSQIDTINDGAANEIPASGIKLGTGQAVKSNTSGAVYAVDSNNSRLLFNSADDFLAYGYTWPSIETFPSTELDSLYPNTGGASVSKYLYDQPTNSVYLMDHYGCYKFTSSMLTSFGQNQTTIQSGQTYSSSIFPFINLGSCRVPSLYVKSPDQATVYWVDSGQRHPISSWSKLQSMSGQTDPYVITLSNTTLATLPIGTTL